MKRPHPLKWLRRHRKKLLYTFAVVAILCGWGGCQFGKYSAKQLQCNTITLPPDTLPGAGALRIAFFSDVHSNPALFGRVVDMIIKAQPDLILFGGDLVTAEYRFRRTRWAVEGFRKLAAAAPCYAILGNHDYEKLEQVERVLSTAGVKLLRNETQDWTAPSGTVIRLVGLGDYNEGDEAPARCLKEQNEESAPVLLLSHDPESRWLLQHYDWDILLSGHTHGGQIGNPFTGEVISFRSSMPAGLFSFGCNRQVFVTRGVGAILNMRFFCPPEVNLIEQKS